MYNIAKDSIVVEIKNDNFYNRCDWCQNKRKNGIMVEDENKKLVFLCDICIKNSDLIKKHNSNV